MKIGHHADKHSLPTTPTATESAKTAAGAAPISTSAAPFSTAPAPAAASAKVELSSTASTLLSTGASPEFDAEKVGRISAAISSGTFKVNPEAIADKLISNAQELLGKVQAG